MKRRSFYPLVLASVLTGCASTIGNRAKLSEVTFEVGKTNKDIVASTLGLPANISQSEALGLEYWAYRDKPELTGVIYALPTGGGTVSSFTASTGQDGSYDFEDAAVIYIFDKNGIMVDVRHPEHK
ncbi:MAG TPA: hypothetical protein ENJ79_10625 [Gammaproteobacteria bacterium]|nr:hypothetical protein [Gammaproteobacteria bacterium]